MPTYARLPVAFAQGEGVWLLDADGRQYLDALSGIAVCSLGHAHPEVARAVAAQCERLLHTSNLYQLPLQEKLGARLAKIAGMDAAFFCNSGAEANEAAIKLARLDAHRRGNDNPVIVVMEGAFHGRTLGALAATDAPGAADFAPLPGGFARAAFNDLEAARAAVDAHPGACAVLVEPVQGEGGVRPADGDYLRGLRALCDEKGLLLIFDEVQTGVGRTGAWYCWQHHDARPDILTTAKALGNGVPIGACLARGEVAGRFAPGAHGSTFGGNCVACAAALTVLDVIERDGLCEQAKTMGDYIAHCLGEELANTGAVREIRNLGMMIGVELDFPCKDLVARALDEGLLINVTAERVVRLLPPLIFDMEHAHILVSGLAELIKSA